MVEGGKAHRLVELWDLLDRAKAAGLYVTETPGTGVSQKSHIHKRTYRKFVLDRTVIELRLCEWVGRPSYRRVMDTARPLLKKWEIEHFIEIIHRLYLSGKDADVVRAMIDRQSKSTQLIAIELVTKMREKFPDCPYTIFSNMWDDGTIRVECRYGEFKAEEMQGTLHTFMWYSGEITYKTEPTDRSNSSS